MVNPFWHTLTVHERQLLECSDVFNDDIVSFQLGRLATEQGRKPYADRSWVVSTATSFTHCTSKDMLRHIMLLNHRLAESCYDLVQGASCSVSYMHKLLKYKTAL